jgi:hypothetical protein
MASLLCALHCIALHCWDLACGQEKPHMFSCQIEVPACFRKKGFPFFLKKSFKRKKRRKGLGTIVPTQAHLQYTHTHTHSYIPHVK